MPAPPFVQPHSQKFLLGMFLYKDMYYVLLMYYRIHIHTTYTLVGDVSEEFGSYLFGKDHTNKLTVEKFQTFHEELTLAVLKLEVQ